MANPLGIIVDQNSNASQVDTYALVLSLMVVNTISASYTEIQAISADYDYCIDLNVQGQMAGIGWSYAPSTDTFASPPPPPVNWAAQVEGDFDQIANDLLQCLSDAGAANGNLTPVQLATAFSNALNDSSSGFSPNQWAIMQSIYQYILNGG